VQRVAAPAKAGETERDFKSPLIPLRKGGRKSKRGVCLSYSPVKDTGKTDSKVEIK